MAPAPFTAAKFATFLGSGFVPACALLQPPVGLRAYLPTLVPQANKPKAVPDQTALMFWANSQSHNLANGALAIRIYQNLHGDAYDMTRSATTEVPVALPAAATRLKTEQPYFLFNNPADWMLGKTLHVVGARPASQTAAGFISSIYKWAADFQKNAPKGIDAALICCGDDYAVAWVHAAVATSSFSKCLDLFASLVQVHLKTIPRTMNIKAGLWNKWDGIDYSKPENTSLNIQLTRPPKPGPVK